MERDRHPEVRQAPALSLQPSPAVVLFAEMLMLSWRDVEGEVRHELEENPALEAQEWLPATSSVSERLFRNTARLEDPIASLHADMRMLVPRRDHDLLEYILGSLDERGFLDAGVDEIAQRCRTTASCVESVLAALREHGPAGIAARDTRECLLLQLDRVEDQAGPQPLVRRLVADFLPDLARRRYGTVAQTLGVDRGEVSRASGFIATRLRPFALVAGRPATALVPDLVVEEGDDGELNVSLLEKSALAVRVSDSYLAALAEESLPLETRNVIAEQVQRASSFVRRLEERWATILAVARAVVAAQAEFIRSGPAKLRPMTRASIAEALGVHESTVGRVVARRSMMLPNGTVVSLERFFDRALAPQTTLAEIVGREERPLSDEELAALLRGRGFEIARRTVAKYRHQLGIAPQRLR